MNNAKHTRHLPINAHTPTHSHPTAKYVKIVKPDDVWMVDGGQYIAFVRGVSQVIGIVDFHCFHGVQG